MRARLLRPTTLLSLAIVALAAVMALAPQLLAPGDPLAGDPSVRLLAPGGGHLFGTDALGRDVYTRVVHGAFLSLAAATAAVLVGGLVGGAVGLVCGALRGRVGRVVDFIVMRFVDVLIAVPGILLALIVVATLGFGAWSIALGVGLGAAGSFARVMRAQVLRVRGEEYVEAASTLGVSPLAVLGRHILPNAMRPVLAMAALELGTAILSVSTISFLGFGAQPPAPEWGALVSDGRDYIATAWWLTVLPGAVIVCVVLAVTRIARVIGVER
ncbi:peptide ABC transporter permease [Microbacterium barkeri]|uniref:Peptide ABC transporter permease n=1 Tax=Microbacterium barkeri TaxID=33917 RepID=A0A9W6LW50_9MICO|nr:ABC transporter permease [Microbacterium barkeri]MDI6942867.1 ABC transporter permease [Microbacterium barkeri]MDR6877711.1 peptide/nickel transport system permease protein [Microbacterium barkeri]GLJ60868.1 peptide ABC transporter permease [Microbacterium barkeri]